MMVMKTSEADLVDALKATIRAVEITEDTVLFVDINQIDPQMLCRFQDLPKGLKIVGVVGQPNVQAMTREELQNILKNRGK